MCCVSYWSRFSGVVENDLKNTKTSICDVQAILLNLFSADTILIGHSFEHSLYALKVKSYRFIFLQNRMCYYDSHYHCVTIDAWFALLNKTEKTIAVCTDDIV